MYHLMNFVFWLHYHCSLCMPLYLILCLLYLTFRSPYTHFRSPYLTFLPFYMNAAPLPHYPSFLPHISVSLHALSLALPHISLLLHERCSFTSLSVLSTSHFNLLTRTITILTSHFPPST